MASQTTYGKAFEYACALAIKEKYQDTYKINFINNNAKVLAHQAFLSIPDDHEKLLKAAAASLKVIHCLEPQLQISTNHRLRIRIQADNKGQQGDVRDVVCLYPHNGWRIGLSCKHNSDALKHSRLSQHIDFGKIWLNHDCSTTYFSEIQPIFNQLADFKKKQMKWRDLPEGFKRNQIYIPLLKAFLREFQRILSLDEATVCKNFIQYIIGYIDFYKVIAKAQLNCTEIEAINIHGTLNRSTDRNLIYPRIPQLKLPNRCFHADFKPNSNNTLEIIFDNGWQISLRIHNASSSIEPSLKFDIQPIGIPHGYFRHIRPWEP